MKNHSIQVLAAITAMLLLSGCSAILDILYNAGSPTTASLSELESRTLSHDVAASGYDGKLAVTSSGRQYVIQNNVIDSAAAQVVEYSTANGDFAVKQHSGSSSTMPVSFPSIFIGNNNGHETTDSDLPKRDDAILSIPTRWTWSDSGATASADFLAAYSLWFTSSAEGDILGPEKSLEIWLFNPGSHAPSGSAVGNAVIQGANWTIWSDGAIITYVASSKLSSVNFDLKPFIGDAIARRTISNTDYLHDILAGFRIWSGGAGLSSNGFGAVVN